MLRRVGGVRLPSSFRSRISLLQARVRYGSRPCSRVSRERADKGARQLLLSVWLVCHRSSRYIEHTCTSQSIVCEWHQFQGLNVMIYRPAPGPWAKLSSHTLNLLLTRLGSRKILFARGHGIRSLRCGAGVVAGAHAVTVLTCIIQLELFASYM